MNQDTTIQKASQKSTGFTDEERAAMKGMITAEGASTEALVKEAISWR